TQTATAGPYLSVRRPRFIRVRNVERIGRIEDVDLGVFGTFAAFAAPRAWGYDHNGVGGSLGIGIGTRIPSGFARFGVRGSMLQTSEGTDSATFDAAATLVSQGGERHLLVLHGSGGVQRNIVPGREFDI